MSRIENFNLLLVPMHEELKNNHNNINSIKVMTRDAAVKILL